MFLTLEGHTFKMLVKRRKLTAKYKLSVNGTKKKMDLKITQGCRLVQTHG